MVAVKPMSEPTITVEEKFDSRETTDGESIELLYVVSGTTDAEDTTAKTLVKKSVAVYIQKVYEEGDFAGLGIGT